MWEDKANILQDKTGKSFYTSRKVNFPLKDIREFLAVQWFRLSASMASDINSIWSWGTKILQN